MSTRTGLLRIASALEWIGAAFGALILLLGWWASTSDTLAPGDKSFFKYGGIILGGLIMGAAYGLAWIVKGFAPGE